MGASGRVARDPSECGGAPSRLSATRCRAPSRSPVLAHELAQDLQKPAFRALTTCVVLFDADQSDVRGGNMPMLKTKSAMTMTAERPPRRGASRPTARSRRPRSSAARTATRCAGRPRAAALLAARPRAHRPPARPLQGRVRPLAHGAHGPPARAAHGRRQPPPNAYHTHPLHFLQEAQCLMDCSMVMVLMEA